MQHVVAKNFKNSKAHNQIQTTQHPQILNATHHQLLNRTKSRTAIVANIYKERRTKEYEYTDWVKWRDDPETTATIRDCRRQDAPHVALRMLTGVARFPKIKMYKFPFSFIN